MPMPPERAGFVGYDDAGNFVHYCDCGAWGAFGYGASVLRGKLGKWYCLAHRPQPQQIVATPKPEPEPEPPAPPEQGSLF